MSATTINSNYSSSIYSYRSQAAWNLIQIMTGAFLLALCAQIKIPLPFSPIPLTLQTLMVLLLGYHMGSRNGLSSMILYSAVAFLGLPVLAGGRADMFWLISPPAGYIVGMMVQVYLSGRLREHYSSQNTRFQFSALLFICFLQLSMGAAWLSLFVGFKPAIIAGVFPFIPGEILKVLAVISLRKSL